MIQDRKTMHTILVLASTRQVKSIATKAHVKRLPCELLNLIRLMLVNGEQPIQYGISDD